MEIITKPLPYYSSRFGYKPEMLVVHWSAGPSLESAYRALTSRGLSYHDLIDGNTVWKLVSKEQAAWHCAGLLTWNRVSLNNLKSIGFCVVGSPDTPIKDESYESLAQRIAYAGQLYKIRPSASTVFPHRHFKATACPGNLDLDRVIARSSELYDGQTQPIPMAVAPAAKFLFGNNLSPGDRSEEVGKLQDKLISLGVVSDVAGMQRGRTIYGPRTKEAVTRLQLQHRLISSSGSYGAGYVGPRTRALLNSL